ACASSSEFVEQLEQSRARAASSNDPSFTVAAESRPVRASLERPTNFAVASLGGARSLLSVVVAGYALRTLRRAAVGGRVHEAEHLGDGRRAIAKVFALLDEHAEARVRHEFELLRELDVEGVVRPLALERSGDELVLLLEYVPGRSLAAFAGNRPLSPA